MIGSRDFRSAMRGWEGEVSRVAAELVHAGVAPYAAIEQAKQIVSQRRRDAARASVVNDALRKLRTR